SISTFGGFAQNQKIKSIEVQGKAERTVTPDEIYLRITLKEYKSGGTRVTMNELESNLVNTLKRMKINRDHLTVDNIYGYNWNWKKKKAEEYLATKSFRLKLGDVKSVNTLIDQLDPEGLNSVNVAEISHSRIDEIRLELKAEALKNAKNKAKYLLEAVDETLGSAVEIQEVNYGYESPIYARNRSFEAESVNAYKSELEFKSIDIKSEFRVVFEIK
ncbi:MAG: SIMPL domain-containing protein, partial [Bacteroidota bacterium]